MAAESCTLHYAKNDGTVGSILLYPNAQFCPEPRLNLGTYYGEQYAALGDVNSPDATPLRVFRESDGKTYAVLTRYTEPIPTGSFTTSTVPFTFTVPYGITVLKVVNSSMNSNNIVYIGVTPGKQYTLKMVYGSRVPSDISPTFTLFAFGTYDQKMTFIRDKVWFHSYFFENNLTISYSPEINKQTPTVKDY